MPDEPEQNEPDGVDPGLIARINAETNGQPRDSIAAASNEFARHKAAGEPEVLSPITKAYFEGFKNLGIVDRISEQWAAELPTFAEFAKGLNAGFEVQGVKFVGDEFLESMREALDKQQAPFKVNLAKEALEAFDTSELFRQIRDSTTGAGAFRVPLSPSFFMDPTPTADLDIVRATIDTPDEPRTIEEVPAEVVTDIRIARLVIREEIVEALNEAFENRQPKGYWTNGRVAVLVGIVGVAVAVIFGILTLIF
jgi:hypothetical protein